MLWIWCFKKSHIKLIFTCFLHMLEWHEEVWIRIVVSRLLFSRKPFSERRSYMAIFISLFIVTVFYFKFIHYSTSCHKGLCVYHWMILMTASRKLISMFSNLICSDTKRIDKMMCFSKNCRRITENRKKWICHWIEVNNFSIFWSVYIYCAFIINSYHTKSRKIVIVTSCKTGLIQVPVNKSTLVQVMVWSHQATNHYLSQRWPRSISPYGINRPHWVRWSGSFLHIHLLSLFTWIINFS